MHSLQQPGSLLRFITAMIYIAPASATYKITKGNREIKQRLMELSRKGHACGYRVKRLTAAFTSIAISINRLEHDSIISTIPDYVYKRRQEVGAVALLAGCYRTAPLPLRWKAINNIGYILFSASGLDTLTFVIHSLCVK